MIVNITLCDKCSVQLTKEGAEYLSGINIKGNLLMKSLFANPIELPVYTEGEIFHSNLKHIAEIYLKTHELGLESPFTDTIQVEIK
jgi:hypothetical protein